MLATKCTKVHKKYSATDGTDKHELSYFYQEVYCPRLRTPDY